MPDHELRRRRLLELIRTRYKGDRGRFIDDSEVDPTYLSRLLMTSGPHRKKLGEKLASKIEKNCGLTKGWFDIDEAVGEPSGHYELLRDADWPFSFSRARFNQLEPQEREEINDIALHFLERFEDRRKKAGKRASRRGAAQRRTAKKA